MIETKRLILRKIQIEDADAIFRNFLSDEKTAPTMLWKPIKSFDSDEFRDKLNRTINLQNENPFSFVIVLKEINEPIGVANFKQRENADEFEDWGVGIGSRWIGCGYGTEALQAIVNNIFENTIATKIHTSCFDTNTASEKMMCKCGFVCKGIDEGMRTREYDGFNYRVKLFILTRKKWKKMFAI